MKMYLELQTNIKIINYNGYTNLYKIDILLLKIKKLPKLFIILIKRYIV